MTNSPLNGFAFSVFTKADLNNQRVASVRNRTILGSFNEVVDSPVPCFRMGARAGTGGVHHHDNDDVDHSGAERHANSHRISGW